MNALEKSLLSLEYSFDKIEKNIFLVNNFLNDSEVISVMNQIGESSEKDWEKHYMDGVADLAERKYGRRDIENLLEEELIEITYHWVDKNLGLNFETSETLSARIQKIFSFDKNLIFDGAGTIQRQYSGAQLTEHVDNHADPLIEYAVIMYVNDDYTEGELFFSNLGIEIKPAARSLIIFPSGEDYLHGVKAPGEGPLRYVLPSFVRRAG